MNLKLLNTEIQQFISDNLNSDISKLILRGSPFKDVSIKEIVEQIEAKKKCEIKLTTWFSAQNIYYPNKLNIEQTSSEITSKYKSELLSGNHLIDITGGFGVDTFYFSKHFKNVTHCEIDYKLSNIAHHNFEALKVSNIDCINANGIDYLKSNNKTYDWIFVDPSRRHNQKGKVFYLKDCLPNLVEDLDILLNYSDNILIKASPMLDISVGISELKYVKEINIIALNNDVKELLFIIKKGYKSNIKISTINFTQKEGKQEFSYLKNDETEAEATYSNLKTFLYEPNAAILKSGAFNLISLKLHIDKLHVNTHLYTSNTLIDFPGRKFKVIKTIPY
ncbi:MAG: class I SAM-dependent methyltransferase, partial [Flavobacteriaceae bacterium]|nr:class I SAM-dependent methyltransferase [Flavobacteriaceae bacterium]